MPAVQRDRCFEMIVEPDEIERGTYPGDAGDHVKPAQEQI
jgi:hypothetical protein